MAGPNKMNALAAENPVETMVLKGPRAAGGEPKSNYKSQITNLKFQDPLSAGLFSACGGVFHITSPKRGCFLGGSL